MFLCCQNDVSHSANAHLQCCEIHAATTAAFDSFEVVIKLYARLKDDAAVSRPVPGRIMNFDVVFSVADRKGYR